MSDQHEEQSSVEQLSDRIPDRWDSHADRATHLLTEYKAAITLTSIAVIVLVASGRMGIPEIPPWWRVVVEGVAIGAIPAAVVAKFAIIDPFIPDPRLNVLVLDLDRKEYDIQKTPRTLWAQRIVGEYPAMEIADGPLDYVVSRYDYDEQDGLSIEGVNEELTNPVSMIVRDERINEIYTDLQYKAAELDRFKARSRTARIEYDREVVNSLIAAIEHGLEFDPGTMERIVEDELEESSERSRADQRDRAARSDEREVPTLSEVLSGSPQQAAATDGGQDEQ